MANQDPLEAWSRYGANIIGGAAVLALIFVIVAIIIHALWPLTVSAIAVGVLAMTVMGRMFGDGAADRDDVD